jgi:alpha-beta hydrolase superfamily lysophospholipase
MEKWYERGITGDPGMDAQIHWFLGQIISGLGDLAEMLDTASRIEPGNIESWYQEWNNSAIRIQNLAQASLEKGHRISAGELFLRASTYYRMADFFHIDPSQHKYLTAARNSVDCFVKGLSLKGTPVELIDIPYEKTTLTGYFFKCSGQTGKAPLVIAIPGGDAWAEENKYIADGAVDRGYHCLLINGPGQGLNIRDKNLPFRPDWEKVIIPVVDFVIADQEVDPNRMALFGNGLGGLLVTRAVAYEHRIKAGICNPGLYDLHEAYQDMMKTAPWGKALLSAIEESPEVYNETVRKLGESSPIFRVMFENAKWTFGADSSYDLHQKTYEYAYGEDISQIRCDMLIMESEDAEFGAGQAKKLFDQLTSPKEYIRFTLGEAASLQCQSGALSLSWQRMFDWLDEHL